MVKRILFILFIISLGLSVFARSENNKADSLKAELAKAKPDTNKVRLLTELSNVYFQQDLEISKEYGRQVLALAEELKDDLGRIRGNNLIARCYAVQNNLPMALKYFQAALVIARETKTTRFEGILLSSISAVYTTNNDFTKALEYGLEAKKVNEQAGIKYFPNLMVNIGLLYVRQEKYKEALHYYNEGLRQEKAYGTPATEGEMATLYLNIGGVYIRIGDFQNALYNFYKGREIARKIGHTKNETLAIANLGETYLRAALGMSTKPLPDSLRDKNTNLEKAYHFFSLAEENGEKLNLIDIRSEVASSLSELYRTRGQYEKAYNYYKKHVVLRDSMRDIGKEKEFAKVEAEFLVRRQTDSLNYLNALKDKEIKRRKLERNGGIVLLGLAGIISLQFVNRQKLKHIQKRKIAEAEKKRAESLARQQLQDFTRSIYEKNELLEKFSAELEKYQAQANTEEQAEKENTLQLLQNAVILNDEQWVNFQALFNKVHIGYINRVKEKFPDLTTAELRYMLLAKLGLTNKEMAAMLGVSAEAVRVSKHRLLKKIQLPENLSLDEAVQKI